VKAKKLRVAAAALATLVVAGSLSTPAMAATVTKTGTKICLVGQHPATSAKVSVITGDYRQRHTWTSTNDSGWRNVAIFTYHRTVGIRTGNYVVSGEPSFETFSVGCASDPV